MREIKFRAWDEELERMFYSTTEQFDDSLSFRFKHFETDDPVYMQYTGLRDKNGRNIYEGDVVDYIVFDHFDRDTQHRGIVKWDKQEAAYYLANVDGSDFHGSYIHYLGWVSCRDPELEVIGNIYENPELLEANDE